MEIAKRQKWVLFAAASTAMAAPMADRVAASAWRLMAGEEPPEDPAGPEVDWGRAIAWTATAALVVAVAQVVARRGAAVAWHRFTGERPPIPRVRNRRKRRAR
ncbi:MAG: DUF4235 domain-containing protein [Gemmatimonadaceae bacterium]